jgi:AcrR family transcriptional regulator
MSTPAQEPLQGEPPPGLRSRRKQKTRLAIQDAALELFAEQGFDTTTVEQIAARAEVSAATFFRYFASKGEVIYSGHGYELPALHRAIIERPDGEDDLLAVRNAFRRDWVPRLDRGRVVRQLRAAASSERLMGLSVHLGIKWQTVISEALAERRGLPAPDQKRRLTAAIAMAVFGNAANSWVQEGCPGDLASAVDQGFELMAALGLGCGPSRGGEG